MFRTKINADKTKPGKKNRTGFLRLISTSSEVTNRAIIIPANAGPNIPQMANISAMVDVPWAAGPTNGSHNPQVMR
jgi:hypothetical protein